MPRRRPALAILAFAAMACTDGLTTMSAPDERALVTEPPDEEVTLIKHFRIVGYVPGATFQDAAFQDDKAIIRGDGHQSAIIDITDAQPTIQAILPGHGGRGIVSVIGKFAYDSNDDGIAVVDISDPAAPIEDGALELPCGSASHTLKVNPPDGIGRILSVPASTTGDCATAFDLVALDLKDPGSATIDQVPYPTGISSCRQFAVLDGPVHDDVVALCKQGTSDVAQIWDLTDPPNPVVTGSRAAPTGLTWHSAAFGGDGEIVMLAASDGSLQFYDGNNIGGAALAVFTPPQRTTGPRACAGEIVPGASDPYWAVLGCGANGTSVVSVDVAGSSAVVEEYAFFRPSGSNAWSAYWYDSRVYTTDRNSGLFVLNEHGGSQIGRNRTGKKPGAPARHHNPRALSN